MKRASAVKKIFLETHNIKKLHTGFGQFNYHLAKALSNESEFLNEHEVIINCNNEKVKKEIGKKISYNKYLQITRYPFFRIKRNFNLWHSVNQNTKIEPASPTIPYLLTIHDINFLEEETGEHFDFRMNQLKNKIQRSSAIVYISEFAKKSTHKHFSIPDIPEYVIYNGNNLNYDYSGLLQLPGKGFQPKTPFIFSIGQVVEKKNFHTLIDMIRLTNDLSLVIAGEMNTPYTETLKQKIALYQLENRVFLLGKISETEKIYYYQNCLAFAFPSLREGFRLPVLEAMTFGKPVFLSNKTSLPEIGGKHAFCWNNFDPVYMAKIFLDGMDTFLQNKEMYASAYKKRAQKFTWENAAKEYTCVYKSILNQ